MQRADGFGGAPGGFGHRLLFALRPHHDLDFFGDAPHALFGSERDDFIDRRMMQPQAAKFFRREQRNQRGRKMFAQTQQRRRGHHGVTEPIHPAHKDPSRLKSRHRTLGLNCGFLHGYTSPSTRASSVRFTLRLCGRTRLPAISCTQNQFAKFPRFLGALQSARFRIQHYSLASTRAIAILSEWQFPGPASMRYFARPTMITKPGVERAMIAQRKHRRGAGRGTIVPEERNPQTAVAGVLVREQAGGSLRI